MAFSKTKVSSFFVVFLIQALVVSSENATTPTMSAEDLVTSSLPMTAGVLLPSTPGGEAAKASSQSSTENSPTSEANVPVTKPVKQTTSLPEPQTTQMKAKPVTEHPAIHHNESTHHSKPTHHGESNDTHKNDSDHTGPHGKMGHPHEPSDADALTEGNKVNEGWQISIYIVVSLISGIIAFVIVMVVKSNRQMRHVRLRESQRKRKRELAREKAAALRAIKTEEPKPHTEKKKDDNRLSFLKHDPEESIPLLELHITDGEAPVLSGHLEKQRPQDIRLTEPSTFDTDTKPPMEENANIPPETPTIQIA